ncbi:hypothetical protein ACH4C6_33640 [Streptomyces sp. NPDC017943]|uniref:hypothetical protein n=1 Tax=Streptomyces sp. NPDC017943 TaxID=3365019 RepID=UPI00378CE4C0
MIAIHSRLSEVRLAERVRLGRVVQKGKPVGEVITFLVHLLHPLVVFLETIKWTYKAWKYAARPAVGDQPPVPQLPVQPSAPDPVESIVIPRPKSGTVIIIIKTDAEPDTVGDVKAEVGTDG